MRLHVFLGSSASTVCPFFLFCCNLLPLSPDFSFSVLKPVLLFPVWFYTLHCLRIWMCFWIVLFLNPPILRSSLYSVHYSEIEVFLGLLFQPWIVFLWSLFQVVRCLLLDWFFFVVITPSASTHSLYIYSGNCGGGELWWSYWHSRGAANWLKDAYFSSLISPPGIRLKYVSNERGDPTGKFLPCWHFYIPGVTMATGV